MLETAALATAAWTERWFPNTFNFAVLALALVNAAARSGSALPRWQDAAATPGTVRRAEDFMQREAEEVLTVADIANAAGCNVRALQLAFRRFRGVSPTETLRRVRLELSGGHVLGRIGFGLGSGDAIRVFKPRPLRQSVYARIWGISVDDAASPRLAERED
jgi:hypothetical protein